MDGGAAESRVRLRAVGKRALAVEREWESGRLVVCLVSDHSAFPVRLVGRPTWRQQAYKAQKAAVMNK
jgi:hypothetical protein